jgi:AmmeMemoRadiSam system protein B
VSIRESTFSGSFYPDNKNKILEFIADCETKQNSKIVKNGKPKAIIVPHAGYIYSGGTANHAYQKIEGNFARVVVIGPSHRVLFDGMSISKYDSYKTPLGDINIDNDYIAELENIFNLNFYQNAHQEHSTETQAPFIKHYLPDSKIVEIIYSDENRQDMIDIIEHILKDNNNLLVISTDLSHFFTLQEANKIDALSIKAIENLDFNSFNKCEACGKIGVSALLSVAKKQNLTSKIVDYTTSYKTNGDDSSVVGYLSAIIY